ncbi:MAG: methyltransferase domain-containing protein [Gluconacetobacter diazotrophicus]|nr:methyltransferase domain-containing protein [Gluconacetobacter diazotrophicus]
MTTLPADRIYYAHAGRVGLIRRLSLAARQEVFRLFMARLAPGRATTVLDVGVSLDVASPEANVLERCYPHRENLTCAGIGDGAAVRRAYPGVGFVQIAPHAPLPFADGQFDVVYSNAVVEHVGSRARQQAFVRELCRVGKRVFVVVPNRLFPVEHHTGLPLVHYLPPAAFRGLLRHTRFAHWAEEENLNPVLAGEFRRMFPPDRPVEIRHAGLGLAAFRSNLVAIG